MTPRTDATTSASQAEIARLLDRAYRLALVMASARARCARGLGVADERDQVLEREAMYALLGALHRVGLEAGVPEYRPSVLGASWHQQKAELEDELLRDPQVADPVGSG